MEVPFFLLNFARFTFSDVPDGSIPRAHRTAVHQSKPSKREQMLTPLVTQLMQNQMLSHNG